MIREFKVCRNLRMEHIEQHVEDLTNGLGLEDPDLECDFTIADQNADIVAKGVKPAAPDDFRPVLRQTVTYIVCAVVINDADEVLMMQEAKPSCAGQWYLPAGRMEEGESIEEATKREVLEETGLDMNVTTLVMVESAQGSWIRFILTGNIIGGNLKTPAEADAESLQAKWVQDYNELSLRGKDIVPVIERVRQYRYTAGEMRHGAIMPGLISHTRQLLRVAVVARKRANHQIHILVSEREVPHLPMCEINPAHSVYSTLKKFMQQVFPTSLPHHKPHGLLSVEHSAQPGHTYDGLCLNLLISVKNPLEDAEIKEGYTWLEVGTKVADIIVNRLQKSMTISLNVIR